jgi:nucleotide-binding universal stress UspA family protein
LKNLILVDEINFRGEAVDKEILVPVDGSKSADRVLDFARDLAGKYSAEVVVINVFDEL